jgi:hypothetical protein
MNAEVASVLAGSSIAFQSETVRMSCITRSTAASAA